MTFSPRNAANHQNVAEISEELAGAFRAGLVKRRNFHHRQGLQLMDNVSESLYAISFVLPSFILFFCCDSCGIQIMGIWWRLANKCLIDYLEVFEESNEVRLTLKQHQRSNLKALIDQRKMFG